MDTLTLYAISLLIVNLFGILMGTVIMAKVTQSFGSELEIRSFRRMVGCYLSYCVSEALMIATRMASPQHGSLIATVLMTMKTLSCVSAAYHWYFFTVVHQRDPKSSARIANLTSMRLPYFAVLALCLVNLFTGFMFSFDVDLVAYLSAAWLVCPVVACGYVIVASARAIWRMREAESRIQREGDVTISVFAILPVAGAVFNAFIPGTPVVSISAISSILLVFSNMQEASIFNDALTGLNNRRRADQFLAERAAAANESSPLTVFVVDVDLFKQINDTYGHLEGDRALVSIATGLRRAAGACGGFVARWGGDEFVLSCSGKASTDPEGLVQVIEREVRAACERESLAYEVGVTVGYATCHTSMDSLDLIAQADEMLYERKRERSQHLWSDAQHMARVFS